MLVNDDDRHDNCRTWAIATIAAAALPAVIQEVGKTVREYMKAKHKRESEEES